MYASQNDHDQIVELLLRNGADRNIVSFLFSFFSVTLINFINYTVSLHID
jgi:ankyrin repeat protein